jgi:hypothetical protein
MRHFRHKSHKVEAGNIHRISIDLPYDLRGGNLRVRQLYLRQSAGRVSAAAPIHR